MWLLGYLMFACFAFRVWRLVFGASVLCFVVRVPDFAYVLVVGVFGVCCLVFVLLLSVVCWLIFVVLRLLFVDGCSFAVACCVL